MKIEVGSNIMGRKIIKGILIFCLIGIIVNVGVFISEKISYAELKQSKQEEYRKLNREYNKHVKYDSLITDRESYTNNKMRLTGKILDIREDGKFIYLRILVDGEANADLSARVDIGHKSKLKKNETVILNGTYVGLVYHTIEGADYLIPGLKVDSIGKFYWEDGRYSEYLE